MRDTRPFRWSQAVTYAHAWRIERRCDPVGGEWYEGCLPTPHGYVYVYSQRHDDRHTASTHYRAIVAGREYVAVENVARRPRGLAIMGRRFIERLVREVGS